MSTDFRESDELVDDRPPTGRGRGRSEDAPAALRGGIDRTPPQDTEAEQAVLGSMLMSKDAIADTLELVKGVDFYRPAHEFIFDAILDLYGRGEPADAITVAAELSRTGLLQRAGGPLYLHDLVASVAIAANASYYAQIVREKAVLRRLVEASLKIAQMGYAGEGDVTDIVDKAQAAVYAVTDGNTSEDYQPLSELLEATLDEMEAISSRSGDMAGVPTGFIELDELTNGLHGGQMVILAARPAVGKSTLGLDFSRACSIKHGLTSAIFSLEMSKLEITMRLLSAEAQIPLNHIRKGTMNEEDWQRVANKMATISSAPLYIDDSPNLTMMEIRAKARRLKQKHDLRLIVIDYLQLMTSGKKVESRQLEVSEFSRQIKLLAKELSVPVVAMSQLNRGPEQRTDKKPMVSDLRESGCLTADTRILRADTGAEVTIGELFRTGKRDIPVWSVDEHGMLRPATMTHAFSSGVKEVFRMRMASGREIKATANHPFLTLDGWKPLGELSDGSRLATPRRIADPLGGQRGDDHEVTLLAHMIGDGSFVRRQPIRYASVDEANLCAVGNAATALFGITPVRDEYAAARVPSLRLPAPYRLTHGRRNPIAAWLDRMGLFGLRSYERFIPDWVFGLPLDQVQDFIGHLWATDGSVRPSGERQAAIYYASTSRRLIDDLARLLLRCGIVGRINVAKKSGYRDSYHLHISGVEQPPTRHGLATNDLHWDTVVSIESIGEQEVFDATVPGTHNFIADGIVVHNSLEQDADIVILLHREDIYDKESPRLGEADFIVAKNRNGPTRTIVTAFQGHYSRFVDMQH